MKNELGYGTESKRPWDKEQGTLWCSSCHSQQPYSCFHKDSSNKYGFAYWCKNCANKNSRANHKKRFDTLPEYRKSKKLAYIKSRWNMTQQEYLDKLHKQGSVCSICNLLLPDEGHITHLDHDHKTGRVRDFLCTNCNRGLGHFQDSPRLLFLAFYYLMDHKDSVDVLKEGRQK